MLIRVTLLTDFAGKLLRYVILDVFEKLLRAGQFGGLAHTVKIMPVQFKFQDINVLYILLIYTFCKIHIKGSFYQRIKPY